MNVKLFGRWAGASVMAGAFAAAMAGSLLGCNLLRPKKAYGESCTMNTDCASMDCVAEGSMCTKDCVYDRDCGDGNVCRQKEETPGDHCAKPIGNPAAGTCMNSGDCQNGHCLKRVGEDMLPGICSRFCVTPDDCPAGMKICDKINDTAVNKMCIPGDAAAPVAQRPSFVQPTVKKPVTPGQPAFTARPAITTPTPVVTTPAPTPQPTTPPPTGKPTLVIKPRTKK
ncbi:MAG: hypothetical protein U0359_30980 [Byssovorax sp.]